MNKSIIIMVLFCIMGCSQSKSTPMKIITGMTRVEVEKEYELGGISTRHNALYINKKNKNIKYTLQFRMKLDSNDFSDDIVTTAVLVKDKDNLK
jgi:hypothetical protein